MECAQSPPNYHRNRLASSALPRAVLTLCWGVFYGLYSSCSYAMLQLRFCALTAAAATLCCNYVSVRSQQLQPRYVATTFQCAHSSCSHILAGALIIHAQPHRTQHSQCTHSSNRHILAGALIIHAQPLRTQHSRGSYSAYTDSHDTT